MNFRREAAQDSELVQDSMSYPCQLLEEYQPRRVPLLHTYEAYPHDTPQRNQRTSKKRNEFTASPVNIRKKKKTHVNGIQRSARRLGMELYTPYFLARFRCRLDALDR